MKLKNKWYLIIRARMVVNEVDVLDLAILTGLHIDTCRKLKSAPDELSVGTIMRICRALKLNLSDIEE